MPASVFTAMKLTSSIQPARPRRDAPQANDDQKGKRQQQLNDELGSQSAGKKSTVSPTGSKEGFAGMEPTQSATEDDSVDYWRQKRSWPKQYLASDDQTRQDIHASDRRNQVGSSSSGSSDATPGD